MDQILVFSAILCWSIITTTHAGESHFAFSDSDAMDLCFCRQSLNVSWAQLASTPRYLKVLVTARTICIPNSLPAIGFPILGVSNVLKRCMLKCSGGLKKKHICVLPLISCRGCRVIVGAPKANSSYSSSVQSPGALYKCRVHSNPDRRCTEMDLGRGQSHKPTASIQTPHNAEAGNAFGHTHRL